ncbi:endonuclease/exonuclease/phosphatase family protein [Thiorhodovibrio litoralis]|uniref:endonuclease/exonuclease/phosphatase family protein n=1 Tax=Thiorhodovibrio litoralis TaxID=2952932 RepID=UPI00389B2AF3|nr:hypothetical protein Thiosp_03336 [Thiorhodovibrio litoralis]
MRLVSWNLGHQCREDSIPNTFFAAIEALSPDVLSLNEYVHGSTRANMVGRLKSVGLSHLAVSQRLNGHNQVLVASRYSLAPGSIVGTATDGHGGASNFLHVQIPTMNLDFVGVRAPAYSGVALHDYWNKLLQIIRSTKGQRIAFMGDLNTDPDQPKRSTARYLRSLREEGWLIPVPDGLWSFASKAQTTVSGSFSEVRLQ